ncbi:hypothetical protein EV182_005479, partial [Spiromyces aspiralis]
MYYATITGKTNFGSLVTTAWSVSGDNCLNKTARRWLRSGRLGLDTQRGQVPSRRLADGGNLGSALPPPPLRPERAQSRVHARGAKEHQPLGAIASAGPQELVKL